jgi:hypothetical protein
MLKLCKLVTMSDVNSVPIIDGRFLADVAFTGSLNTRIVQLSGARRYWLELSLNLDRAVSSPKSDFAGHMTVKVNLLFWQRTPALS